jgi:hypothetical protein
MFPLFSSPVALSSQCGTQQLAICQVHWGLPVGATIAAASSKYTQWGVTSTLLHATTPSTDFKAMTTF